MSKNLNITRGVIFSQEIMLELTKVGLTREKAYKKIQSHAKNSLSKNIDLIELVKKDKSITTLIPESKINKIFSYSKHLKNVNYIFKRVFR